MFQITFLFIFITITQSVIAMENPKPIFQRNGINSFMFLGSNQLQTPNEKKLFDAMVTNKGIQNARKHYNYQPYIAQRFWGLSYDELVDVQENKILPAIGKQARTIPKERFKEIAKIADQASASEQQATDRLNVRSF